MAGVPGAQAAASAGATSGILEMAFGLALVLALIFAAAWAMRRMVPGAGGGNSALRIVAALSVGPRERLLLVDAGGRQLLLGVTAQQITPLHSFDTPLNVAVATNGGGDFAARLRELMVPTGRR